MSDRSSKTPYAKRSFGQNFLVDQNYISRIVAALDIKSDETIIEIGAGRGAMTEHLALRASRLVAIEFDRDLVPILAERFSAFGNFELVEADALTLDFTDLVDKNGPRAKLVANLPYNISTAILLRLIGQRSLFSTMVLMFQREVVDRIVAEPGSSDRGYLTVIAEAAFRIERLFDVAPAAFSPRPKVWSSVLRLTPLSSSGCDAPSFRTFVGKAFAQKRKTLLNNLKNQAEKALILIESSGIDPARRAETLTLLEWQVLYNRFTQES